MDTPQSPPRRQRPRYVEGLKASAARVEEADADRLVRRMLAAYGLAELYEWYQAITVGKVVFDVDGKASQSTAAALLEAALAGVAAFFGFMPDRVLIASSHGGDKLSYRLFVPGYRMQMADIKHRLVRLGLDKNRPFDSAIYGTNQKLRMVGSIKTKQDRRPLKLVDATGADIAPTHELLLDTLVQVVDNDWPLLEEPADPVATTGKRADAPSAPPQDLAICPAPKRQRGRPPAAASIPSEALQALLDMHFVEPRFVSATADGFVFDARNRDRCPNCSHDHERQNWWCISKPDAFLVSNYSERCTTKHYPKAMEAITTTPPHANFDQSLALLNLEEEQAGKLRGALHYHQTVVTLNFTAL